jgi:hypothetical protein
MRDKQFVAAHRGGLLSKENHRKLIRWARECSEHVLPLIDKNIDSRLVHAIQVAKAWENDHAKAGDAMKAAVEAHAVARESSDPVLTAIARSIGHTVATAHMADHSLGGALYALKAMQLAGKSTIEESEWQHKQLQQLPSEIVELVLTIMSIKQKALKI